MTYKAEIPYGAYWSTPFTRWQGAFAHLHSVEFAAHVAKREAAGEKLVDVEIAAQNQRGENIQLGKATVVLN